MISTKLIGILASLIAAIFFGLYPVPRRYVNFGITDYMISMSLGLLTAGFIISLGASLILNAPLIQLSMSQWGYALLAGILWCLGTIMYVSSVDCAGVGRATPIKNLTLIFGVLFGLFLFQEYTGLTLINIVMILTGSLLLIYSGKKLSSIQGQQDIARPSCPVDLVIPEILGEDKKTTLTAGIILALGAALMYGLTTIPIKTLTRNTQTITQFIPIVGLGALTTATIADPILTTTHTWKNTPPKQHLIAALSGLIWIIGFTGLTVGIKLVKLSISWPIAMSSTVFAVIYAIFLVKEIDVKENMKEIIIGLTVGIAGIILLGLSI